LRRAALENEDLRRLVVENGGALTVSTQAIMQG
jgi:hypothetical protein